MRVNLFELHFPSSHFSSQTNKWVFYLSTFPFFQPNTYERKLNLLHRLTFLSLPYFLSSHFSTPPTEQTLRERERERERERCNLKMQTVWYPIVLLAYLLNMRQKIKNFFFNFWEFEIKARTRNKHEPFHLNFNLS